MGMKKRRLRSNSEGATFESLPAEDVLIPPSSYEETESDPKKDSNDHGEPQTTPRKNTTEQEPTKSAEAPTSDQQEATEADQPAPAVTISQKTEAESDEGLEA